MSEIDIKLQVLVTEREGMIAENMQRHFLDQSMAYSGDNFDNLARRISALLEIESTEKSDNKQNTLCPVCGEPFTAGGWCSVECHLAEMHSD